MGNNNKHLIVAVSGIGLCYAGQIIQGWFIKIGGDVIAWPFVVLGIVSTVSGFCCCAGAALLQLDRYKKK